MSANAEALPRSEVISSPKSEASHPHVDAAGETSKWNPESFGREQIRGLVRRIFLTTESSPVKQVVFSGAEPQLDVADICDRVGLALALETSSRVALVQLERPMEEDTISGCHPTDPSIKSESAQVAKNLWRVAKGDFGECGKRSTGADWLSYLAKLGSEFEYVVIHGPEAVSSEAALLGQITDGIVLVLRAHTTRKAPARKIKESLEAAHSRILGTVLSERRFPIPEKIYRRL